MIAFKEWDVVCDALEEGRQSVILRKGGIHEGREGFSFAHEEFVVAKPEWQIGDELVIRSKVKVTQALTLTDWEDVAQLADLHIWTEETIRERFFWEKTEAGMLSGSIHVAYVEVESLGDPIVLSYQKKYGGCRSWLELNPADFR